MKKKFDFKLTACLVSLFIGLLLLAFSYGKTALISSGLILMAVSLFFFARIRANKLERVLELTEIEIDQELENKEPDQDLLSDVYAEVRKVKKQKKSLNFTFNLCSILMIAIAIFLLF